MKLVKILLVAIILGFIASIIWAMNVSSFASAFANIAQEPWGVVTLIDLYIGFVLFAGFIFWQEGSVFKTLLWTFFLFILGNVIAILYLLLKLDKLTKTINSPQPRP